MKPMYDRVIIKRKEEEKVTSAGFIIPDAAIKESDQGTIIDVGTGKVLKNGTVLQLTVQVGDTVMFSRGAGQQVKVNGEDLLVMREDDIIGILEAK